MNELNDDTAIYRIFNFYDLVNTLSNNKIRLSQVSRMEDPNELFGVYFDLMCSAIGKLWTHNIDATQRDSYKAQSYHYVTCWTRVPDNIAVWSLYSPARDAIQVSTTYGKLRDAIKTHFEENSYALAYQLDPKDPKDLFRSPDVGAVKYVNFKHTYEKIKQQRAAYSKERDDWWDAQIAKEGPRPLDKLFTNFKEQTDAWMSQEKDVRARIFDEPRHSGPLLKDFRYQHEQEVRFVLQLCRRDGRTKEEYKAHPMAGLDEPVRFPKTEECPPNIFFPFTNANYSDIKVDGRIDEWKYEAMCKALSKFGI
jgi:hypothetical protein